MAALGEAKLVAWDRALFEWINGLAGYVPVIDRLFAGLADDYFVIVAMCLLLVGLWFGTRQPEERHRNQITVLMAMASMGIAGGLVSWCNLIFAGENKYAGTILHTIFDRPRPFDPSSGLSVHLLFYKPTDPSFPSKMAAVVLGLALAVWFRNKRMGAWLLLMALLVCFARVYVGIHYPSDILGGAVFGLLAVGITYFLFWALAPLASFIMGILKAFYLAG